MVLLTKAEFERLQEAAENYADICASVAAQERAASGEEYIPGELLDRIFAGESALKVWREYRGLTQEQLAAKVGKQGSWLAKIENGKLEGGIQVWRKLAAALEVELDDILPEG
jgi:ribosome-binding protein aMBF1 (putative translation factor)